MNFSLNVKRNDFPRASSMMRSAIGAAFTTWGGETLADMQRRTPVDIGELRGSEFVTTTDEQALFEAGTDHAIYVHQGTYKMSARPFMVDAIEANLPALAIAIGENFAREVS